MPTHRPPQGVSERCAHRLEQGQPAASRRVPLGPDDRNAGEDRREPGLSRLGGRHRIEGPRRGCATARRRRGDSGARRRGVRMAAAAGGTAGGCGVDGAAWLHERRQGLLLADVGRLERRPTGEDGHRDGCYRGDRRGSGLRHIRRDDEPRHARDRSRDGVPGSPGVSDPRRRDPGRHRSAPAAQCGRIADQRPKR